jgi:invasion protein IalB
MACSRRRVMFALAGGAGALVASSALYSQPQHPNVQPRPSPNAPDPNRPWSVTGHDERATDRKAIEKQNQAEVKASVEKLYVLISELKEQVEKSDVNLTLPVSVVKKSQEIEKLAKHVKELAKG